jgi:hypothetical protein
MPLALLCEHLALGSVPMSFTVYVVQPELAMLVTVQSTLPVVFVGLELARLIEETAGAVESCFTARLWKPPVATSTTPVRPLGTLVWPKLLLPQAPTGPSPSSVDVAGVTRLKRAQKHF